MKEIMAIVGISLLILPLVIFQPLIIIWALNSLFPLLAIPYTFWNWAAVLLLQLFLKGQVSFKSK